MIFSFASYAHAKFIIGSIKDFKEFDICIVLYWYKIWYKKLLNIRVEINSQLLISYRLQARTKPNVNTTFYSIL